MAVLESTNMPHPAIEALFTIDEETGMTGALKLKRNWLKGTILLNLDTEDDDEIGIGCAGGIDISATRNYPMIPVPQGYSGLQILIKGLNGGHSGVDIHLGLGNANKILARLLQDVASKVPFGLVSIDGGSLRNAIPREAKAEVVCKVEDVDKLQQEVQILGDLIKLDYKNH